MHLITESKYMEKNGLNGKDKFTDPVGDFKTLLLATGEEDDLIHMEGRKEAPHSTVHTPDSPHGRGVLPKEQLETYALQVHNRTFITTDQVQRGCRCFHKSVPYKPHFR